MILPRIQQTILTDGETAIYALAAKRFRRRRAISRAVWCIKYFAVPAMAVSLVFVVVMVSR